MAESNREGSLATALADSILGEVTPQKKTQPKLGLCIKMKTYYITLKMR